MIYIIIGTAAVCLIGKFHRIQFRGWAVVFLISSSLQWLFQLMSLDPGLIGIMRLISVSVVLFIVIYPYCISKERLVREREKLKADHEELTQEASRVMRDDELQSAEIYDTWIVVKTYDSVSDEYIFSKDVCALTSEKIKHKIKQSFGFTTISVNEGDFERCAKLISFDKANDGSMME